MFSYLATKYDQVKQRFADNNESHITDTSATRVEAFSASKILTLIGFGALLLLQATAAATTNGVRAETNSNSAALDLYNAANSLSSSRYGFSDEPVPYHCPNLPHFAEIVTVQETKSKAKKRKKKKKQQKNFIIAAESDAEKLVLLRAAGLKIETAKVLRRMINQNPDNLDLKRQLRSMLHKKEIEDSQGECEQLTRELIRKDPKDLNSKLVLGSMITQKYMNDINGKVFADLRIQVSKVTTMSENQFREGLDQIIVVAKSEHVSLRDKAIIVLFELANTRLFPLSNQEKSDIELLYSQHVDKDADYIYEQGKNHAYLTRVPLDQPILGVLTTDLKMIAQHTQGAEGQYLRGLAQVKPNDTHMMMTISRLYYEGNILPKDTIRSVQWFEEAIMRGALKENVGNMQRDPQSREQVKDFCTYGMSQHYMPSYSIYFKDLIQHAEYQAAAEVVNTLFNDKALYHQAAKYYGDLEDMVSFLITKTDDKGQPIHDKNINLSFAVVRLYHFIKKDYLAHSFLIFLRKKPEYQSLATDHPLVVQADKIADQLGIDDFSTLVRYKENAIKRIKNQDYVTALNYVATIMVSTTKEELIERPEFTDSLGRIIKRCKSKLGNAMPAVKLNIQLLLKTEQFNAALEYIEDYIATQPKIEHRSILNELDGGLKQIYERTPDNEVKVMAVRLKLQSKAPADFVQSMPKELEPTDTKDFYLYTALPVMVSIELFVLAVLFTSTPHRKKEVVLPEKCDDKSGNKDKGKNSNQKANQKGATTAKVSPLDASLANNTNVPVSTNPAPLPRVSGYKINLVKLKQLTTQFDRVTALMKDLQIKQDRLGRHQLLLKLDLLTNERPTYAKRIANHTRRVKDINDKLTSEVINGIRVSYSLLNAKYEALCSNYSETDANSLATELDILEELANRQIPNIDDLNNTESFQHLINDAISKEVRRLISNRVIEPSKYDTNSEIELVDIAPRVENADGVQANEDVQATSTMNTAENIEEPLDTDKGKEAETLPGEEDAPSENQQDVVTTATDASQTLQESPVSDEGKESESTDSENEGPPENDEEIFSDFLNPLEDEIVESWVLQDPIGFRRDEDVDNGENVTSSSLYTLFGPAKTVNNDTTLTPSFSPFNRDKWR